MQRAVLVSLFGVTSAFVRTSHAMPEPWPPKLELSSSASALAPLGDSEATRALSDEAQAAFPLALGAGVRLWRFYAGVEGSVGIAVMGDSPPEGEICHFTERDAHKRCSVRLDRILGVVRFHFLSVQDWDAWAGLAYGREWLHFTGRLLTTRTTDPSAPEPPPPLEPRFALTGWWLDLRAGVEYLPLAWMRVGAFATFGSGRYASRDVDEASCRNVPCRDVTIADRAFHHWAGVGIRFAVVLPEPADPSLPE